VLNKSMEPLYVLCLFECCVQQWIALCWSAEMVLLRAPMQRPCASIPMAAGMKEASGTTSGMAMGVCTFLMVAAW
jgi:hypothetical protein